MRICIIDSYLNIFLFDKNTSLDELNSLIIGLAENNLDTNKFYIFSDYEGPKIRLCHLLLRIIDTMSWIPAFFAMIPLQWCKEELIESLLGLDPDVISVLNLRWGCQLQKLLRRHYPQWTCLTGEEGPVAVNSCWRQYNAGTKVSIVLPTYNGVKYIRQSIESCLGQTHRRVELIVVDDGSSEDIQGVVTGYNDPRIKYLRHSSNLGLAEALNTGFRNSTGEYLTWTSDDNYYAENAIEEMVRFLQSYPEIDFVYADSYRINEGATGQDRSIMRNLPPDSLKEDNFIGACFIYKRKVYEAVGEYNPRTSLLEDYDYWIRVWKQFRMQRLFRPLYYYRFHQDSLTSKHSPAEIAEKVKLVKQLNRLRKFATRFYPTACI